MIERSVAGRRGRGPLTDEVLHGLWEQVALLRRYRIAHRNLRLANVFLSDTDEPWLMDFGFSEVAASEALLDADVAQLVASLAIAVGAERAVIRRSTPWVLRPSPPRWVGASRLRSAARHRPT